jgi:hypothetical protein
VPTSASQRPRRGKATHLASNATLDLVPRLELRDGNEHHDSLATALDVDLTSSRDLERAKIRLELAGLEVDNGLGDELLSLGRRGARSVGGAEDLGGLCSEEQRRER